MRKVVVLDAGHGGKDPGAVGNGYREKNLALDDTRALRSELLKYDVDVIMTRDSDIFLPIRNIRKTTNEIANKYGVSNTAFVSSHWNSYYDPTATGWEILVNYPNTQGDKLAHSIHREVNPNLTIADRGIKYRRGNVGVLRAIPATVLIEHAFISNPSDIKKHLANRQVMAKAYARGIANYLGLEKKPVKEVGTVDKNKEVIPNWAKGAVDYVQKEKIMVGDANGNFRPNDPVTRAELAVVIQRINK